MTRHGNSHGNRQHRGGSRNTRGHSSQGHRRPVEQQGSASFEGPGVQAAVWRDEGAAYMDQQGLMNRNPRHRSRRDKGKTQVETPATANEAFRLIDSAVVAEKEGRYSAAMKFFLEGGEMLAIVGQNETDDHIKELLCAKAAESLDWTAYLADYIDAGCQGPPPPRMGRTVVTNVAGRLNGHVAAIGAEFQNMYYTACSSKYPAYFTNDGYRLQCIQNGRRPQMMIVITMYNEDKVELNSTLRKVANNIQQISAQKLPGYEKDDAWKNILVCIVSDGRTKANQGTLEFLRDVGLFDYDAMNITMRGVNVNCHIFEYSVQFMNHKASSSLITNSSTKKKYPPMQVVFALKEHNAGKLNSHEWYFNAFAEQIRPEYTVLLDVGTLPTKTALYRLLTAMEMNAQIGGVCGEIAVDKPIPHLCNWIIAAQHFEYKISNILDKALESVFGFISVLPGAFSAYRYRAIRGPPLKAYFKSLNTPMHTLGPFRGNMYLAEDRILCFELLARKGEKWTMHYVKDAIARTDVPTNFVSLIGQRRRWLNGSFFALVYTLINWGRVYSESRHSIFRKSFLFIQYIYMSLTVLLTWLLLSNYFLVVYFLVVRGLLNGTWGYIPLDAISQAYRERIVQAFTGLYFLVFLIQVVGGLGNKPKHIKSIYIVTCMFYGGVNLLTAAIAGGEAAKLYFKDGDTSFSQNDSIALIATIGIFFLASLLHGEIHHICMTFLQYTALLPTFINVLNTYSFCNLHDLSWGTKGLESSDGHGPKADAGAGKYKDAVAAQRALEEQKKRAAKIKDDMEGHFQFFRSQLLLLWLTTNLGLGYMIVQWDATGRTYLQVLFLIVAGFNLFRLCGSFLFLLYHYRQWFFISCGIRWKMKKRLNARRKKYAEQQAQAAAAQGYYLQGGPPAQQYMSQPPHNHSMARMA